MKNLYYVGISQGKIASVDLMSYDKGWMITQISVPEAFRDQDFDLEVLALVMHDADAEGVILYLGDDPNDQQVYQLSELWYWRYDFHRYRNRFQRRPKYQGGQK